MSNVTHTERAKSCTSPMATMEKETKKAFVPGSVRNNEAKVHVGCSKNSTRNDMSSSQRGVVVLCK